MAKISKYPDGGALRAIDQFIINRSGLNYSILGSALPTAEILSENIYRCNVTNVESKWIGTISSKSGADIVVATTSGSLYCLVAGSTAQYAKVRLFNTTRGDYALIHQTVYATNTITLTTTVPAGWQAGDVVTSVSTTVNSADGRSWIELQITSGITKNQIFIEASWTNTTAGKQCGVAPVETFSFAKAFFLTSPGQAVVICEPMAVNGAIAVSWQDVGTSFILKYKGFLR